MSLTICDTKVLYDTEFEATVAAARHRTEMRAYQCGRHWHLTHADPKKSVGHGRGRRFKRCPHCKHLYDSKRGSEMSKHYGKRCLE